MDRKVFFDRVRADIFNSVLTAKQVDGLNVIIDAFDDCRVSWLAYALATAFHETARTMQPVHEYGGPEYLRQNYDVAGKNPDRARRMGNTKPGDGVRYAGRGYVQLTWKDNYERLGSKLGIDLVGNPGLAMRPDIAAKIMRLGMEEGLFTGLSLSKYLTGNKTDYVNARRIINGTDKAALIAGYARRFEMALRDAGFGDEAPRKREIAKETPKPVAPPPPPDIPTPEPAEEKAWWEKSPVLRQIINTFSALGITGAALFDLPPWLIALLAVLITVVSLFAIWVHTRKPA